MKMPKMTKFNPYQGSQKYYMIGFTFVGLVMIITGLCVALFKPEDFSETAQTVLITFGAALLLIVLLMSFKKKK